MRGSAREERKVNEVSKKEEGENKEKKKGNIYHEGKEGKNTTGNERGEMKRKWEVDIHFSTQKNMGTRPQNLKRTIPNKSYVTDTHKQRERERERERERVRERERERERETHIHTGIYTNMHTQ